jgi:hypothetical protein
VTGSVPIEPVSSQYTTIDVSYQYDLTSRVPDDPFNLLAGANALASVFYNHLGGYKTLVDFSTQDGYSDTDLSRIPAADITTVGTTTYYTVPQPDLPLLQPLRDLGVPAPLVNRLNARLKPVVDSAYDDTVEPYPDAAATETEIETAPSATSRKLRLRPVLELPKSLVPPSISDRTGIVTTDGVAEKAHTRKAQQLPARAVRETIRSVRDAVRAVTGTVNASLAQSVAAGPYRRAISGLSTQPE